MTEKQKKIDELFLKLSDEYDKIRKEYTDTEKRDMMMLFYIDHLKEIVYCLRENAGIKLISIERFAREKVEGDAQQDTHMYVPVYIDSNGDTRMSSHGYPYKATALLKVLYGFSSFVGNECLNTQKND